MISEVTMEGQTQSVRDQWFEMERLEEWEVDRDIEITGGNGRYIGCLTRASGKQVWSEYAPTIFEARVSLMKNVERWELAVTS